MRTLRSPFPSLFCWLCVILLLLVLPGQLAPSAGAGGHVPKRAKALRFGSRRPPLAERRFTSAAVEKTIAHIAGRMHDPVRTTPDTEGPCNGFPMTV